MNKKLAFCLAVMLPVVAACNKDDEEKALSIESISSETFTFKGGLGSAVISSGGKEVTAESSDPDWLRVQSLDQTVLFNVISYTGSADRTGTVTVSAEDRQSVSFTITQTKFQGLIVTPTVLTFSETQRTLTSVVTASADYDVKLTENPNDIFSYTKTDTGVEFSVNRGPGRTEYSGRAQLTPTDGGDPVVVTLTLPQKSVYDYLVGTWEVTANSSSGPSYPFTFSVQEDQSSYNISIAAPRLGVNYPVTADFINGKVRIQGSQELGYTGSEYLDLHFNGPINGSGVYIFTTENSIGWEATPIFDDEAGTITLSFKDNGQGMSRVGRYMVIWGCTDGYFEFSSGSTIVSYENLQLQKSYTD